MKKFIYLVLVLSLFFFCGPKQKEVEKIMVDGVAHIKNPEEPLRGEVLLDIEKILEIDPYQFEEVRLGWFDFIRDTDGEVILFNSNITEAQRFNHEGEYLGSLVRKGQGPGEFPDRSGFKVCFMNKQIWATGNLKLAKYGKEGRFLNEKKLGYRPEVLVDDNRFFIEKKRLSKEELIKKLLLVDLSSSNDSKASEIVFFQAENVGAILGPDRKGLMDSWATPNIDFTYDHENQRIYIGLNTEYKIYVKNLNGETVHIIEKPHNNVKVSQNDKKKLLSFLLRDASSKWMLDAYPDNLVAIKELKMLPNGYLAVYLVSGPGYFEVDVFDPEGRFVYIMKPPQGVSLEMAKFYSFGTSTTETTEDGFQIYVEYRIKNLSEIFRN